NPPQLWVVWVLPVYDAGSLSSLAGLGVSQEPKSLNATAEENVTLSCTFQNRNGIRAKVLWLRGSGEDVVLDASHPFYRGRLRVSSLDEISKGNATLTLSKLDERDSGLYQCCIEIQNETTGMGEGTNLRVMRRNQSVTGKSRGEGGHAGPVPSRRHWRQSGPKVGDGLALGVGNGRWGVSLSMGQAPWKNYVSHDAPRSPLSMRGGCYRSP
uniref:Ig-like domain-containing protein n=1 Tax=Chrysemys picta bellii TaxID=8478 RepID=A0A8C3HMR7_CHRPI